VIKFCPHLVTSKFIAYKYIHKRVHDDIIVIAMMSSCALGIHHALKHKQFQCYTH